MSHAKAMQAQMRALQALQAAQEKLRASPEGQARQQASMEATALGRGLADGWQDPGAQPVEASAVQPADIATLGLGGSAAVKPLQAAAEAGEALVPQAVSRIPGAVKFAAEVADQPNQWANFYREWGAAQEGGKRAGNYLADEAKAAGGGAWNRVKKAYEAFQDYTPDLAAKRVSERTAGERIAAAEAKRLGDEAAQKAAQLEESAGQFNLAGASDKTR